MYLFTSPCVYLRLDVLLRRGDKAGTAEPQHDHDWQEETGRQDPPRKARTSGERKSRTQKERDKSSERRAERGRNI